MNILTFASFHFHLEPMRYSAIQRPFPDSTRNSTAVPGTSTFLIMEPLPLLSVD